MRAAIVVALAACSSASSPPPPAKTPTIDPKASVPITSEEVTFGNGVPGTLVRPTQPGPWPGIVLIAGSGPTDRDWNSPGLVGKNGSGKLLAEALAKHGAVVVRYDKIASGVHQGKLEGLTFDVYVDEGKAALAYLRSRKDVAPSKLFLAGHSEGGIHATRVALVEGDHIAGLVLLSAAGRSMKDIMLDQVGRQLRAAMPQQAEAEIAALQRAFDDFVAGKEVDPAKVSAIPNLQAFVKMIVAQPAQALVRGLIAFDPAPALAQVRVPVFVYNGLKDVQVDAQIDAKRLIEARAGKTVQSFFAPEADHVLKHETKSVADLRANLLAVQTGYNSESRELDAASVDAIVSWLASVAK